MPSISANKVEAKQAEFMDSFKQAIIVVEHKIRNLEKRKGKLDAYKHEQEQGKELNADQLAAVAKYNEVVQQLDFSRDLVKQLGQIGEETNRVYRKQQKKEQTDRALVEAERYRQLLTFQRVLDKLVNNQRIREDFLNGVLGTVKLTPDDISSLDEFASLISPEHDDPNYLQQVTTAGEHISLLFQGKAKPIAGKNYKEIQALLLSISSCEYFDPQNSKQQQQQQQQQQQPQQQTFSEEPEPLAPPQSTTTASSTTNVGPVPVNEPVPAQIIHSQEPTLSTYNFIQESQIEIGSPHLDPAVVSVSSFAPPQQNLLQQQQQVNNNSQNVFSNTVDNINSGLTDMSLNRLSTKTNDEVQVPGGDIIDDWQDNSAIPNSTYNSNSNPIDSNGRGDGANNMFDRTIRGGFRGGNPRSRGGRGANSYGPRGGGPRGGRGGFQNGRGGGGYRSDRPESDLDGNVYEANRNPRKRRGVGYPYPNASQQQNVSYNSGGYSTAPPSSQQQPRARQNNQVPSNRLNTTYPKN